MLETLGLDLPAQPVLNIRLSLQPDRHHTAIISVAFVTNKLTRNKPVRSSNSPLVRPITIIIDVFSGHHRLLCWRLFAFLLRHTGRSGEISLGLLGNLSLFELVQACNRRKKKESGGWIG